MMGTIYLHEDVKEPIKISVTTNTRLDGARYYTLHISVADMDMHIFTDNASTLHDRLVDAMADINNILDELAQ